MNKENNKLKRLNYSVSELGSIYHDIACKFGISDSVMVILYGVSLMDGKCLLNDICKMSGVPKQTINSAVRKLESNGMIYLENHNEKSKMICLTEKGRDFADKTVAHLISAENKILESWSENDADLYIELNQRYAKDLKKQFSMIEEMKK